MRALHHYDRLALLRPSRTGSGYRMYRLRDLERLEQIVALKFIGLPLKQIKAVLDRDVRVLPDVLRAQRQALEEKRRRLGLAIAAIADAERTVTPHAPADAAVLRRIIEVMDMQDSQAQAPAPLAPPICAQLGTWRGSLSPQWFPAGATGPRLSMPRSQFILRSMPSRNPSTP